MQETVRPRPLNLWLYLGIPIATLVALILLESTSLATHAADLFFDRPACAFLGRHSFLLDPTLPPLFTLAAVLFGLLAQLGWAKREALIADDTAGPLLREVCDLFGCHLPLVAAPDRLRLLARDVEQHPSVPDGLLITASVRNDASFAQPYPVVTIVLSDAQGQRLAMRRFQPEDYVGDTGARTRGLPAGATTAMVFEVQDPCQRAVAFSFSFE